MKRAILQTKGDMHMPLKFMIGRSGSGKTTTIINRVIDKIAAEPTGAPLFIIVPEQASFQTEHALIRTERVRGNMRASAFGFRRLAQLVLREVGGSARVVIADEGKKMLLYKLLQQQQSQLKLFGRSGEQFGFISQLSELYSEFKHYSLTAEQLEGYVQQSVAGVSPLLTDKLHDLQHIYRQYEYGLSQLYIDRDDTLDDLAEAIPRSEMLNGAEVWIDGFHSFTPQEYSVIMALLDKVDGVTVSLTLDRPYWDEQPPEMELFYQQAMACRRLYQFAEALGHADPQAVENLSPAHEDVPVRFAHSPLLAHLEKGYRTRSLWKGGRLQQGTADELSVHCAPDRRTEIEGALREMVKLAREQGARWREMTIFVRNLDDYEHLIAPLMEDYNIPYFLDKRRGILHHPLAELMRAALDVVQYNWRYEDVFRCIKTGLLVTLDDEVTADDLDRLENVVLACGIHGYRWTDGREWRGIPSLSLEAEETENGQPSERDMMQAQQIEKVRRRVAAPLQRLEKKLKKARHATEMCIALYELLEELEVADKLEQWSAKAAASGQPLRAREHIQIHGGIIELMEQMVDIMAEDELQLETFAGLLETGLAGLRLGVVPPAIDQVLIGSLDRTRPLDIKYAFVLGINDGIVPSIFPDQGILNEAERLNLTDSGLELAPGITRRQLDEQFIIYHALTVASDRLWISYAMSDEEGRGLIASEVITTVKALFPGLREQSLSITADVRQTPEQQLQLIGRPGVTLPHLIGQLREWSRGTNIPVLWWHVLRWYDANKAWKPQLHRLVGSLFYENIGQRLSEETSQRLYGRVLRTSVSGMEQFVSCPFAHFAARGLKLRERQEYRLKAPDIGQLFHASLTTLAQDLKEQGRNWGDLTPEECVQVAEAAVDKHTPRLQGEILLSSRRYGYITRKLRDIVSRASVIIGEQSRRGQFEPLFLELAFGPDGNWPALRFTLDNGYTMEIVGRIDRVDVAEGDGNLLIRIIDYKSSSTDLKLHEVYYGLALQMLTYLDVLLTHAEEKLGQKADPAGALYFHVHNPMLQSGNRLSMEQSRQELLKRFKMKGLLVADRDVIGKMDSTLEKGHSAILPVAVKADGGFYSSSAVASPEQWQELLTNVRQTARQIGEGITGGVTQIEPYRIDQEKACTFCAYKSVCQFDESIKGNAYNMLKKPNKNETWELLQSQQNPQEGESGHERS